MRGEQLSLIDDHLSHSQRKLRYIAPDGRQKRLFHSKDYTRYTIPLLQRSPQWRDREKIREVYKERNRLARETGHPHDVDHIIPLNHPYVCGLHVHNNLRAVRRALNECKNNDFPHPDQLEIFDA